MGLWGVVGLWGCGAVGLWVGLWWGCGTVWVVRGCGALGCWGCGAVDLGLCFGVVGLWGCGAAVGGCAPSIAPTAIR